MSNTKEDVNVAKMYGEECIFPKEEFIKKYNVSENGLTDEKASKNLNSYGYNEITRK